MNEERCNPGNPVFPHTDWWDVLSVVIYFLAMMTAATRLVATEWVPDLDVVQTVTFLGFFAGIAIGKSIFPKVVAFLLGLAYGIFVIPWQLGLTLGIGIEWKERLFIMVERLRSIVLELVLREDVTDNLFFLLIMAILFWIITVYSGYQLVRYGDVWRAMLPGGLAVFVIHNYDPIVSRRTWYLAFYILFFLIILARNYYLRQHRKWKLVKTYVPPDAGFDFIRFALLMSVIIVLLAWNSPAMADSITPISNLYHAIERPWLDAKERMSFMFASLRATVGFISDYYAEEQPLGRGNANTDSPVMQAIAPRVDFPGHRFYWRARVYDNYDNGRWTTTVEDVKSFIPDDGDLLIPDGGERTTVEVEITPRTALITVYSPSQPIWFSQTGNINYIPTDDEAIDIVNMKSSPFVRPGEPYTVRASLPTVTEVELREAGTDYPQWVRDRYLQVPETITSRTRVLAERLAEGKDNPYDISLTITAWLRDNIEYVEQIEQPPQDEDVIDWFLFEYRKGFCNYYSTSMVLMLRSLGIPARWAVGYAQGREFGIEGPVVPDQLRGQVPELFFDEEIKYLVSQIDAHAWPEVYFPEIGWIEFEPTVSQRAIFRPSGVNPFDDDSGNSLRRGFGPTEDLPVLDDLYLVEEEPEPTGQDNTSSNFIFVSVISGVLGVALIFLAVFYRRNPTRMKTWWDQVLKSLKTPVIIQLEFGFDRLGLPTPVFLKRLAYEAKLPIAAKSFLEINKANDRLGLITLPSFTPSERVKVLTQKMPDLSKSINDLLGEYQKETYSTLEPDEYTVTHAGRQIRERSIQIRIDSILQKFKNPLKRNRN